MKWTASPPRSIPCPTASGAGPKVDTLAYPRETGSSRATPPRVVRLPRPAAPRDTGSMSGDACRAGNRPGLPAGPVTNLSRLIRLSKPSRPVAWRRPRPPASPVRGTSFQGAKKARETGPLPCNLGTLSSGKKTRHLSLLRCHAEARRLSRYEACLNGPGLRPQRAPTIPANREVSRSIKGQPAWPAS